MFAVGGYTLAKHKVVWPNIASGINASVVSSVKGKPVVPQHIVTLVACDNLVEAHYLCSILNSGPFNFAVQSYSQKGGKSFGTPHVLENVRVPTFESNNETHIQLAALSRQAHIATSTGDVKEVSAIEAEIDILAAQVWGLTTEELKEIR
ncbi:MAG: SAM-dependent DNA methyltransferase, partial [Thaumarchaeota archaeon]|nr:SAM-dependent DNA methyltransferase [Nitrososphaerota archaeon]